jgi:hypothetical protein
MRSPIKLKVIMHIVLQFLNLSVCSTLSYAGRLRPEPAGKGAEGGIPHSILCPWSRINGSLRNARFKPPALQDMRE